MRFPLLVIVALLQCSWPILSSPVQQVYGKVCYEDLGCIVLDDSWYDPLYRPVNLMPQSRDCINTTFTLHTKDGNVLRYSEARIADALDSFDVDRLTKIIIHGYLHRSTDIWVKRLTRNLLAVGDFNVVVVDWYKGVIPLYTQATANARLVGLEVADFVNHAITRGAKAEDFHLIGHSLAAHAAGYAGERIANLGRITALDPAEPYFQWLPEYIRLDPSDADFVDVVHSDSKSIFLLGYGMDQPVGHVDFYPNGGKDQPGCDLVSLPLTLLNKETVSAGDVVACNHNRAIDLYIDSMTNPLATVGYQCQDYETFVKGKCHSCGPDNTKCAKFGLDSVLYPARNRSGVKMFFNTNSLAPFSQYHYHVLVKTCKPVNARHTVSGTLRLTITGSSGVIRDAALTSDEAVKVTHGEEVDFLLTSNVDVGEVKHIQLHWRYAAKMMDYETWCSVFCNERLYVAAVSVSQLNNYPESARLQKTYDTCPGTGGSYAGLSSHGKQTFVGCSSRMNTTH